MQDGLDGPAHRGTLLPKLKGIRRPAVHRQPQAALLQRCGHAHHRRTGRPSRRRLTRPRAKACAQAAIAKRCHGLMHHRTLPLSLRNQLHPLAQSSTQARMHQCRTRSHQRPPLKHYRGPRVHRGAHETSLWSKRLESHGHGAEHLATRLSILGPGVEALEKARRTEVQRSRCQQLLLLHHIAPTPKRSTTARPEPLASRRQKAPVALRARSCIIRPSKEASGQVLIA